MTKRFLQKGKGWRLGWNPTATPYQALLGGEDWALELTEAEFQDFCRLLAQLVDSVKAISTELMDEERITCEAQSDLIWLEIDGYAQSYGLRLILNQGRRGEGSWSEIAVSELRQALINSDASL